MSDEIDPQTGLPKFDTDGVEAMPVEAPRRAASLTLRSDDAREFRAVSMEAANKSLADALGITYRLLQLVMFALVILFLFSGFQQINQSETGIRVDLGKIKIADLEPGFQFSLPYPLGEIVKVERGNRSVQLDESFWPKVPDNMRGRSIDQLSLGSGPLKPGEDGSLLTADANIAHAQWTVVYSVTRAGDFVKNLYQDSERLQERAVVRAAVERAAVRVVSEMAIDDLLKRGGAAVAPDARPAAAAAAADAPADPEAPAPAVEPTPTAPPTLASRLENSIESQVRRVAQETLDALGSGIEISQVIMRSASPPIRVRQTFNDVQIAQSKASKAREEAIGERNKILAEAAGSAAAPLLHLIDRYEFSIELGDKPQSDRLFALIGQMLEGQLNGRNVVVEGRTFDEVQVGGDVVTLISDSQRYRSTAVQQAQRQADNFTAKRAQYIANPMVFASNEWSQAFKTFLAKPNVEIMIMPANANGIELLLTSDPEISRDAERQKYAEDVDANLRLQRGRMQAN